MFKLFTYIILFPVILAVKMIDWMFKGIVGIFKLIGLIDIFK